MSESVLGRPAGLLLAQGYGWRAGQCWVGWAGLGYRSVKWRVWASSGLGWGYWGSLGVPASFQAGKLSPRLPCQARDIGMSSTTGSPFLDLLLTPETVAIQGHIPECFVWEGREVEVAGTVVTGCSRSSAPSFVLVCGGAVGTPG